MDVVTHVVRLLKAIQRADLQSSGSQQQKVLKIETGWFFWFLDK